MAEGEFTLPEMSGGFDKGGSHTHQGSNFLYPRKFPTYKGGKKFYQKIYSMLLDGFTFNS